MAAQLTIKGAVTAVNIAYGAHYPSIQLGQKPIKAAPVWFLLENDVEFKTGDTVSVLAAPGLGAGAGSLYAIRVVNRTDQVELTLRDSQGFPLWTARFQQSGGVAGQQGAVCPGAGTCIDPAGIQTVSGVVDSVVMGAGIQMPRMILKTAGNPITAKLGPERILLSSDFGINAGDQVAARIAFAACSGEFVALQVTNSQGKTIVLRNDDGAIAWNR
jgi:hypothetical protein